MTGAEEAVRLLLEPRSVAIVGASSRPDALSWWPLHLLQHNEFRGHLYPVNPKYDSLGGIPCYPSVTAIGEPVDVAVIVLNVEGTLAAVRECAEAGVQAVILPTQGFGEMGEDGRAKERELKAIADAAGMRIVGTNTDGVANFALGATMSIQPLLEERIPVGPIGVVSQSGATAASLLVRLRDAGLGAKLHVSAGNETDLGFVDYLSVLVQDPEIEIVLGYLEAVRRPEEFVEVLKMAADIGKPVALIKVGSSEQGARRAGAHTGALAGEDSVYQALFDRWGVIRVEELGDLVAVAKLHLGRGDLGPGGVGILSGSGGQCGIAADIARSLDVDVPQLRPEIEARIDAMLTFGAGFNPCDLTGEIARTPTLAASVYEEFDRDPGIAAAVFIRKKMLADVSDRSVRPLVEAARAPGRTPLVVYAMDGFVAEAEMALYREAGIPVFGSLRDLFTSFRALTGRARALAAVSAPVTSARGELPVTVPAGAALPEADARELLLAYDLPVPGQELVRSVDDAVTAAERLGFPVVVKISDPRVQHKTEIGGVAVGLAGPVDVKEAGTRILSSGREALGDEPAGLLVQEQVEGGVELIAGLTVDRDFGPFVMVGMGGVNAELLRDVALRPAPVTATEAREMIRSLNGAPLLSGFRGAPPCDVDALADAVANLSRLGADGATDLSEVDLNPIVALPEGQGVRILDCLVLGA
ncbi:acetate--CoA ligase family protein [Phycicoccus sp. DTK01]|uniref:acetate--CoA ligase family protein n=1 Tax=Phycicoccus sp. DTK01 TaxID=2785745 RepID=UPI001A8F23B3|nr:acetate--CoA ligase family protein [Phycicoccus sp. DTK01]